ncbi:hypothetical protein [Acidithiobacillus sp.]
MTMSNLQALDRDQDAEVHPRIDRFRSRRDCEEEQEERAFSIRFCELYRKETRTRREEAELSAKYARAYDKAHHAVACLARHVGFSDPDILADCGTTLLDFGARSFDWCVFPNATLFGYFHGVARAYLHKHKDFLTFSRRLTGCGYATADLLTQAVFGHPDDEDRPEAVVAHEYEDRTADLFDSPEMGALEPLYASGYGSSFGEDPALSLERLDSLDAVDAGLQAVEEASGIRSVSGWLDFTIAHIAESHPPLTDILARAAQIIDQLAAITGARLTDLAKRLITRVKAGCRIALTLLQALRERLHPERNRRARDMIDEVLSPLDAREFPEPEPSEPELRNQPVLTEAVAALPIPDTPEHLAMPAPCLDLAAAIPTEDRDLGWLIDTEDLRQGRVPPPKPRYVPVDHAPVDPPGVPPLLDEHAPPGGPPAIVFDVFACKPTPWDTWRKFTPLVGVVSRLPDPPPAVWIRPSPGWQIGR